jgi:hypothetical protein
VTPEFLKGAQKVNAETNATPKQPSFLKGASRVGEDYQQQESSLGQEFKDFFLSKEETPFEKGLGTTIRGAASVGLGLPGNVAQLTRKAGKGIYDFIQPLLGLPESAKDEGLRLLPTTTDIEKGFDVLTEGKYAPSEEERPYYEAAQDITSMFMPGSGPLKAWQRIGIPIAGQLAKEGIKMAGGKETSQEWGKLGLVMGLSIASLANGEKYVGNLLQQSESLMPAGKMIDAKPIENSLTKLKASTWFRGADLPSTRPAKQLINAIENNIGNGQIEGKMAIELRKNANEIQKNLGAFDIYTKQDKKKAIKLINETKDAVMNGLDHYGKTQDPAFWKVNQEANKAYAAVAKSRVIKNFIEKNAPSLKSNMAKNLFGAGTIVGELALGATLPMAAAGTLAGATAGAGILKTAQILYRVMHNPTLRKYYANVLEYAAKENGKAMAANFQKLDDELSKLENY